MHLFQTLGFQHILWEHTADISGPLQKQWKIWDVACAWNPESGPGGEQFGRPGEAGLAAGWCPRALLGSQQGAFLRNSYRTNAGVQKVEILEVCVV